MKRMAFLVSLFVIGLGLIFFGWKLWNAHPLTDSSAPVAKLKEVEKLTVDRATLAGKILVTSAGKLLLLDPETSTLSEVDPVFTRIPGAVLSVSQSPNQNFWLISALNPPPASTNENGTGAGETAESTLHADWYLVDWSSNELKNLATLFTQQKFLQNKSINQFVWNEDGSELLVTAVITDTRKLALATMYPKLLQMRERQTLSENTKEVVLFTTKDQSVYFTERSEGETQLKKQDLQSANATILTTQPIMKLVKNHSKLAAFWDTTQVELFSIANPTKILATIKPSASAYKIDQSLAQSLNGETIGLVEWQTARPETQVASFFTSSGKLLAQTVPREGSLGIALNPDGQKAVLTVSKVSTHETIAPVEWHFFDIYANTEKSIVGLQEKEITILEVL